MMNTAEMDKKRLNSLIDDAMASYKDESKEKIYGDIGASLIALGLEPDSSRASRYILKPQKDFNFEKEFLGSKERYIDTISGKIAIEDAKRMGENFWEVFKKKTKSNICGDQGILKLLKEDKVKEALEKAIPSILIAMGVSGLWVPALVVIAAGIIMLLLKSGIETLCESGK